MFCRTVFDSCRLTGLPNTRQNKTTNLPELPRVRAVDQARQHEGGVKVKVVGHDDRPDETQSRHRRVRLRGEGKAFGDIRHGGRVDAEIDEKCDGHDTHQDHEQRLKLPSETRTKKKTEA